jgi:hypothetical protein
MSEKKKGMMARRLVYFCISLSSVVAVWAMVVKTIAPTSDLSDILTFVGATFGGELVLLMLKRVFSKKNETEGDI